jgi:hypothetical protein
MNNIISNTQINKIVWGQLIHRVVVQVENQVKEEVTYPVRSRIYDPLHNIITNQVRHRIIHQAYVESNK